MLGDPPAGVGGAHHHLQRVAAAPVGDAEGEQVGAPGRPQRAEVAQPQSGAAAQQQGEGRVAGPGVRRPGAPAARAAARPSTRSAAPERISSTNGTASAGSSEASQSQKQTNSAVAAVSPAWQAAPKPRRVSRTTVAPSSRATRSEPSVEPLSTTIARHPGGIRRSTHGSAAASSRQGRTTSTDRAGPPGGGSGEEGMWSRHSPYERGTDIPGTGSLRNTDAGARPGRFAHAGCEAGPHGAATHRRRGRSRVLVVDDDPTVAEIVTGYLDRAGYVVDRVG